MTQDPRDVAHEPAIERPVAEPAALWGAFAPPLRRFLAKRVPPGVEAVVRVA